MVYSNLGVALLGHALAAAAQIDYEQLVQERLIAPLEMAETSFPLRAENLLTDAPTGYSATGIAEAPWTINGWAPAGGARSTPADMVRYAQALLDGSAPGIDALTPRGEFAEQKIGYVWTTQVYQGHTVTFKNGLTAGFASKLILDRANHRAVIVLSNTAAQMDTIIVILFITLVVRFVIGAWRAGGRLSAPDRWSLITSCAVAIWFVAVALFATGVVGAVLRWPELVWTIGTHPFRQAIVAGVTLVSCTLIIGATMI